MAIGCLPPARRFFLADEHGRDGLQVSGRQFFGPAHVDGDAQVLEMSAVPLKAAIARLGVTVRTFHGAEDALHVGPDRRDQIVALLLPVRQPRGNVNCFVSGRRGQALPGLSFRE